MQRSYFAALHTSGSAIAATGWSAQFVLLWAKSNDKSGDEPEALVAAAPLYLKPHSWGEYVFDHAWANAYAQHGLDYYPKLVCAVPFTPVRGSRLLAIDAAARAALVEALSDQTTKHQASSVHILFGSAADYDATQSAHWAHRQTVQFHWTNSPDAPHADYESFLKTLTQSRAKNARAEMRKVRDAGITWRAVPAADASTDEIDTLTRCYTQTYLEHGNKPYLSPVFFRQQFEHAPANWVLFMAHHAQHGDIACSLIGLDPVNKIAYGRYWGALARVDSLHFDACYHQPLQWCIANDYVRFEGGAQGEHKMARGLLPVVTRSAHYIAHPEFAQAILRFTEREQNGIADYVADLRAHSPLRAAPSV